LLNVDDSLTDTELDSFARNDALSERRFELGLIKEGHVAPAVAAEGGDIQADQGLALRVRKANLIALSRRLAERRDFVAEAQALESAQALTVETDGARKLGDPRRRFENEHFEAGCRKRKCSHRSNRPEANDHNVDFAGLI